MMREGGERAEDGSFLAPQRLVGCIRVATPRREGGYMWQRGAADGCGVAEDAVHKHSARLSPW